MPYTDVKSTIIFLNGLLFNILSYVYLKNMCSK